MTIEFKCEHCQRTGQAPDEAGGRMGQCPACGHSMYIPSPAGEDSGTLELTEIDAAEEARHQEEMARTRRIMHQLWSERPRGESSERESQTPRPQPRARVKPIDTEEAAFTVEQYVVAMSQASLEEAEALAAHLVGNPQTVNPIIARAIKEGLKHSSLKNIPAAVQEGFLRKLLGYLNQE